MTLISYAANFEDVLLARALAHVEHGQYIDVGAADPRVASATQALYERGWHGVNLEPAPAHARQLRIARPADVTLALAAGATAGRRPFFDIPGTPLSTFDAERARQHRAAGHEVLLHDAETRTLDQVWDEQLDEHAPLQLLHIGCDDAAGVLAGLDLARHRPWLIVLPADTTLPALSGAGYHLAYDDGHKRFYVAAEQAALAAALRLPPQPADGFVLCEDHPYSHPLAAWRARADAAEAAAAEARTWSLAHVEEWKQKYGQLTPSRNAPPRWRRRWPPRNWRPSRRCSGTSRPKFAASRPSSAAQTPSWPSAPPRSCTASSKRNSNWPTPWRSVTTNTSAPCTPSGNCRPCWRARPTPPAPRRRWTASSPACRGG